MFNNRFKRLLATTGMDGHMSKQSFPVCNEADIHFHLPVRTKRQVIFHRWRDRFVVLILLAIPPVCFGAFYSAVGGWLFGCELGIMIDACFLLMMGYDPTSTGTHSWLDPIYCAELAGLCDSHPDLSEFRDQIAKMGRRFTYGEYRSMKQWPLYKKELEAQRRRARNERAACHHLYKLNEN